MLEVRLDLQKLAAGLTAEERQTLALYLEYGKTTLVAQVTGWGYDNTRHKIDYLKKKLRNRYKGV
jgi:hypothetical protein